MRTSFLLLFKRFELVGHVDTVRDCGVSGWICDRVHPRSPVELLILFDGMTQTGAIASQARPDVRANGLPTESCGFTLVDLPPLRLWRDPRLRVVLKRRTRTLVDFPFHEFVSSTHLSYGSSRRATERDLTSAGRSTVRLTASSNGHDFQGRDVLVEGPLKGDYSLAIINRGFVNALATAGAAVSALSLEPDVRDDPFVEADPVVSEALRRESAASRPSVHTINTYPLDVERMRGRINALHCYAWEESGFPSNVLEALNRRTDAIFATSVYTRDVLRQNGYRHDVFVTGNGCDEAFRRPAKPLKRKVASERSPYTFLHVSSCFPRKAPEVLVRAFHELYGNDPRYRLVIKTFDNIHNTIAADAAEICGGTLDDNIELIFANLAFEDIGRLYARADCLVAASRGEGFLLPAAEAMAVHLPVIASEAGGQADFCTDETAWLVACRAEPSRSHLGLAASFWFEPSLASLKQQMQFVQSCPEGVWRKRLVAARQLVTSTYTWQEVAARVQAGLTALDAKEVQSRRKLTIVSTWNQHCGIATYTQHLAGALEPFFDISIVAEDVAPITDDGPNVSRVWRRSRRGAEAIVRKIAPSDCEVVLFQHHPAHFSWRDLGFILDKLRAPHRLLVVQLHSTRSLAEAQQEHLLLGADVVFVHTLSDAADLGALASARRLVILPHGLNPCSPVETADDGSFHIGSFGFCMPHKGTHHLLIAIALLRDVGVQVKATLLHAVTKEAKTRSYAASLHALIDALGLRDCVDLQNDFLDLSDIRKRLSSCQVIALPYEQNEESASGALREIIGLNVPILCTPAQIFDEFRAFAHTARGHDALALYDSLRFLQNNARERLSVLDRQQRYVDEHSWARTAQKLNNIVTDSLKDKSLYDVR